MSPSHPCRVHEPSQAVVFSNLMTALSAPSHHPCPPPLLTQPFIFPHTPLSHASIPTVCLSCQHRSMCPKHHRRQKMSPLSPNRWLGCAKIHPPPSICITRPSCLICNGLLTLEPEWTVGPVSHCPSVIHSPRYGNQPTPGHFCW